LGFRLQKDYIVLSKKQRKENIKFSFFVVGFFIKEKESVVKQNSIKQK